jgi:hypothetical protein
MITTTIETITPQMAAEMLETSGGNRHLKPHKVSGYARDMKAGRWMENGESIIFDDEGRLADGHHRLTGIVDSGCTIRTVVVRGVEPDSKKTIDMGSSRTASDALTFYGHTNVNNMGAIVRALMSLKLKTHNAARPTVQEVFEFITENPGIQEATNFAANNRFSKLTAMLGAIHLIAGQQGRMADAIAFVEVFSSGIPAYPGCPAHVLRERILRSFISGKAMSTHEAHNLCAVAWDKFTARQQVKLIRPRKDFFIAGYK